MHFVTHAILTVVPIFLNKRIKPSNNAERCVHSFSATCFDSEHATSLTIIIDFSLINGFRRVTHVMAYLPHDASSSTRLLNNKLADALVFMNLYTRTLCVY